MKAGSAFITPLSGLAHELLRPYLKADPAARLFDLRRHDLQKAARNIVAQLAMQAWTPHDLRRTAATMLDRSGYSLEQIGALLAHTRKGVTAACGARWRRSSNGRYARHWTANRKRRSRPPHRRQSPKQHDERAAIAPPFSFGRRGAGSTVSATRPQCPLRSESDRIAASPRKVAMCQQET
jgi:hypothetical protein